MRPLARVFAASKLTPQLLITLPIVRIRCTFPQLSPWKLPHRALIRNSPSVASCERTFALPEQHFSSPDLRGAQVGGLEVLTIALHVRNGHLGGNCNIRLQNSSRDQAVLPTVSLPILPFLRLQLRNCSGNYTSDGQLSNATGKPGEFLEGDSREAALQKLTSLVEGWNLETEGEESHREKKSTISSGMLDDWNFEDWNEVDSEELVEQMNNGSMEAQRLHQQHSDGQGVQEIDKQLSGVERIAQEKVKRVYGIDKCLPPKVTVEYTEATSLVDVSTSDVNKLFSLSKEDEERFYREGLPDSFRKEFDISGVRALLIRNQVVKLCSHLKHLSQTKSIEAASSRGDHEESDNLNKTEVTLIEPTAYISLNAKKKLARERRLLDKADLGSKKQLVLDGLPGSGKSVALAMLVHWARAEGWLVCYIPSAKRWTHGDLYYKNMSSALWDTPVQANSMLRDFLKSHSDILEVIPCRVFDPIPLGEGPGEGLSSGPQEIPVQETFTLKDLIEIGIKSPHAAVGAVVRLRKELSLVEEVPVLIAVDEFNSWFTFSGFHEHVGEFGRRQIHARELAMVRAFRDMTYGPFIVGAFSHSTNVGKLPKQLPGIPLEAKVFLNRFDFLEASIMLKHYMRQLSPKAKFGKRARRALYLLTNGNANELRDTAFLKAAGSREISYAEAMA